MIALNAYLLERLRSGQNTVLIIDEAQNLDAPLLEEVRLLSNLETDTEKLLQIVLTGQPELKEKLCTRELRQLRQRIADRAPRAGARAGRGRTLPRAPHRRSPAATTRTCSAAASSRSSTRSRAASRGSCACSRTACMLPRSRSSSGPSRRALVEAKAKEMEATMLPTGDTVAAGIQR